MHLLTVSVILREPGAPVSVRLSFDGGAGNEAYIHMPEAEARALVRRLRGDDHAPALALHCYRHVETIGEWLDGAAARAVEIAHSVQDSGLGEERG